MKGKIMLRGLLGALLTAGSLQAQDPVESYYQTYCKACHTIGGGRLVGPDLAGILERQDREWLIEWIVDPQVVLASGDAYAQKILAESNNLPMVKSPGIDREMAAALIDYIQVQESGGSQTPVLNIPETFSPADVEQGRSIFMGRQRLTNGGPACVSCHSLTSLRGLGGGRLGVDLSQVHVRLGGSRGLSAWLQSPPTSTMNPLFRGRRLEESEIIALVAFFEEQAGRQYPPVYAAMGSFVIYGLLGAITILTSFGLLWGYRFRGVRRELVAGVDRISTLN